MATLINKVRNFAYRANYVSAPWLNHKIPIDICLELSSHCNMKCSYCYHNSSQVPFEKDFMDPKLAFKIIQQAADLGVNSIKFNYRGEATLNAAYTELTRFAAEKAHGSTFIDRLTNSNFKIAPSKRQNIFEGFSFLTKVKVSYDSFRKEVFETQRAGGDHVLTTENIDQFYNYKIKNNVETTLVIQAVRTKLNADEDILGTANSRWPGVEVSIRDMVAGRIDKDLSNLEARSRDPNARQSCIQAHARMIVHWDGRVSPCCPSIKNDLLIGDLNTQTIEEVFNSDKAKALRKALKDRTAFFKDPCKSCSSFESYQGYKAPWGS